MVMRDRSHVVALGMAFWTALRVVLHVRLSEAERRPLHRPRFSSFESGVRDRAMAYAFILGLFLSLPCQSIGQSALPIQWMYCPVIPSCISYSADGNHIAAAGNTGVAVYSVSTAELACLPTNASQYPNTVALSRDGKTVAIGGSVVPNLTGHGVLELWDVPTRTLIASLNTAATSINSVAISPDGTILAVGGTLYGKGTPNYSGVLETWSISKQNRISSLPTASNVVVSIAISNDGKTLAAGGDSASVGVPAKIELWDLSTGKLSTSLHTSITEGILSVAISPDGKMLADSGLNGNTGNVHELWDIPKATLIGTLNANGGPVAFSPDQKTLAIGVQLWNLSSKTLMKTLDTAAFSGVAAVGFSPDSKSIVDCGYGLLSRGGQYGLLEIWNVKTGALEASINTTEGRTPNAVAFSPKGSMLATAGGTGGTVCIWDLKTGQLTASLNSAATVYAATVAFSPDGTKLADCGYTSDGGCIIEIWDVAKGEIIQSFKYAYDDPITSLEFSPDGKTLASAGQFLSGVEIDIWNVASGQLAASLSSAATGGINSVSFSPDGKTLVDGGTDMQSNEVVEIWDVSNLRLIAAPTMEYGCVYSVAFSPSGSAFADSTQSGVELRSASTGKVIASLPLISADEGIYSLAFSPDGKVLFADNGYLQAFSTSTFSLLGYYTVGVSPVQGQAKVPSLAMAPGGDSLAYTANVSTSNYYALVVSLNPYFALPTVSQISLSPSTIRGGSSLTGTITLSGPAGKNGELVELSSNSTSAKVPASLTIPAGKTSATFLVRTSLVGTKSSATITATLATSSKTAVLTIL